MGGSSADIEALLVDVTDQGNLTPGMLPAIFRDIRRLDAAGLTYAVVGRIALALHEQARFVGDIKFVDDFGLEPMLNDPLHVWARPLESLTAGERENFEGLHHEPSFDVWPEIGSRMMTRMLAGEDLAGEWVVVQEGTYRYSIRQAGGLKVRSVWFEYLATEVPWDY